MRLEIWMLLLNTVLQMAKLCLETRLLRVYILEMKKRITPLNMLNLPAQIAERFFRNLKV